MSTIVILPLGDTDPEIVAGVQECVQEVFETRALLLDPLHDIRPFFDSERHQYNSTRILHFIKEQHARHYLRSRGRAAARIFLAITGGDLFIPILTYVFGEAELNGDVAVASYFRLQNEVYGLPPDKQLSIERLQKEAVHELGHTFGLVHCHTLECVMRTSTYVEDIDTKGKRFCPACQGILSAAQHT